jgi:glycosyltransferase involved in cell wall biosynthesis
MPFAIGQFDLSDYDLIISSSHAVAKGIRKNSKQLHICYCHTPMRYIWDLQGQYLKEAGLDRGIRGALVMAILNRIRKWDVSTSKTVDYFVANSFYIKERIERAYGRNATIIYPPVDTEYFQMNDKKEVFYITSSRMVPYKKIDLIIEAFSRMPDKKLIVIGDGPDFEKVKMKAMKNVELLGYQEENVLKEYLQQARAFVFAAEEDFGIIPVEAQACGTPVIAYGKGGILETIIENKTGIFFKDQSPESLIEAVQEFEKRQDQFDCLEIRRNAERFSKERFKTEFKEFIDRKVKEFFS